MNVPGVHRIARHSVELQVESHAAAAELHAEVSGSLRSAIEPVLEEVLTAACPPDITIRLGRVEIDAGRVPRDALLEALAAATREQLAALLRAAPHEERAGVAAAVAAAVSRLTDEEIALERIALFLEHGAASWRDAGTPREELEEVLLRLSVRAPTALRTLLQKLPPARVGRRLWTQLTESAREHLLRWLGAADPSALQRLVLEWATLLAMAPASAAGRWAGVPAEDIAARFFARVWTLVLAGRAGDAVDAIADDIARDQLWAVGMTVDTDEAVERLSVLLATAEGMLPRRSLVRRSLAARAVRVGLAERRARRGRDARTSAPRALEREALSHHDSERGDAGALPQADRTAAPAADADGEAAGGTVRGEQAPEHAGVAAAIGQSPDQRRRPEPPRQVHTPFEADPLWVRHAGLVLLWPFLPRFFGGCGLLAGKRFADPAGQGRAVLLTAHLADGADRWGEHELLLEKLLCGCPHDEPIPTSIDLRDVERAHGAELLASVVQYWPALKNTSVEGLRRAFVCRDGMLTAIASGWKLEIARAGHDVLLDSLPWGIGVVVLPWMEQPLHVEW